LNVYRGLENTTANRDHLHHTNLSQPLLIVVGHSPLFVPEKKFSSYTPVVVSQSFSGGSPEQPLVRTQPIEPKKPDRQASNVWYSVARESGGDGEKKKLARLLR
jgi:hypothetical protein